MKLVKKEHIQCAAIVQPGEYMIDRWDNRRCEMKNAGWLFRCEECRLLFCDMHWPKHQQPCNYPRSNPNEAAKSN